jgi:cyclophilin family peptidyl-prolyl cis-trans isomerase
MHRHGLLIVLAAFIAALTLAASDISTQASELPGSGEQSSESGLYMIFETSIGSIRCKLFEKEAPKTVRKIVGLAVGKVPYIDPASRKQVEGKRFYDGLIFHRVIPRFMIQGGDPLGTGYGDPQGPGFPFEDEFVPTLKFDVPGRLAMANAGPNTNGSQFFITEIPTPYLNNKHTIFGQCDNLDVVKAIARVPARNDKPIKSVVMKRVLVERIGPAPADAPEKIPEKQP